jgi:hypothetical protein
MGCGLSLNCMASPLMRAFTFHDVWRFLVKADGNCSAARSREWQPGGPGGPIVKQPYRAGNPLANLANNRSKTFERPVTGKRSLFVRRSLNINGMFQA